MHKWVLLSLCLQTGILEAQAPSPSQKELGIAFRTACFNGDLSQVTALSTQGAPLEGRDSIGRTPLILASHGYPEVVKFLLAQGAKIEARENDGDTALSIACSTGDLASAQLLLDAGADPAVVNKYGRTPLMESAREGRTALVSLLIDHHVNVDFHATNDPALVYAVWKDHLSTAKILLDAGADLHVMSDKPGDIARPAFYYAVTTNDSAMMDLLLDHGADINDALKDGTTPLIYAVDQAKPETIQHLLDRGAKLEAKDNQGRTALIRACFIGYRPGIQLLVKCGADINAEDALGETPLGYSGNRGDTALVQLFRDKGALKTDVHVVNWKNPVSPLPAAESWALAVGAIYPQTSGYNPKVLGYEDRRSPEGIQKRLKTDWNITDKATFLTAIDNLRAQGHRADFQRIGAKLADMDGPSFEQFAKSGNAPDKGSAENQGSPFSYGPTDTDDPSERAAASLASTTPAWEYRVRPLRASCLKWKERSGLAWDLCRYANLVSQGYAAGYLNEQEAWNLLLTNAKQVQSSFSSWQEMSDNFLDGREIWAGERKAEFEACAQLLLNPKDPNSPWTQLPWKTDLSGN